MLGEHNTAEDLLTTIRHEVFAHNGFAMLSPVMRAKYLREIAEDIKNEGALAAIYSATKERYKKKDGTYPAENVILEETVARIAEMYGDRIHSRVMDDSLVATIKRIFERLLRGFRAMGWMDKKDGIEQVVDMLIGTARSQRKPYRAGETAGAGEGMFSRTESTRAAYEKRIDELFAGAEPDNVSKTKVLDSSDILSMLGKGEYEVFLKERHIMEDGVTDAHMGITKDDLKKLPEWLRNPVAVFRKEPNESRLTFIAEDLKNGNPIVIGVKPAIGVTGAKGKIHLVATVYDKNTGRLPLERMVAHGDLLYIDTRKSPGFNRAAGHLLPSHGDQLRGFKHKIYTGVDLYKYRLSARNADKKRELELPDAPLFRLASEGDPSAIDALKTNIQDRFSKDLNTFGWWHKSVGTAVAMQW